MRRIFLIALMLLPAGPFAAERKPKADSGRKTILAKEEKEMLKDRELLENLDLLLALDKLECFDLFTDKKADTQKEGKSTQPAQKKSEKKK